ncbi:MAG: hypothetical protein PHH04_02590 [Thomasclavelia sp.]|jgi:hypothetical protein|nr:hypothetical protein [Thomasclavelia sp.]
MSEVVNFNMIVDINKLLKDNDIPYRVHAVGGCSCSGLELIQEGKAVNVNIILDIINSYLKSKWLVASIDNDNIIKIESKF